MSWLDRLVPLAISLSTVLFAIATAYALYAIFEGNLAAVQNMSPDDKERIVNNVTLASNILMLSGVLLCICMAIKHRTDNVVGYMLVLWGAILCWGAPIVVRELLKSANIGSNPFQEELTGGVLLSLRSVGISSLLCSVPLILVDFWYKLVGSRRDYPSAKAGASAVSQEAGGAEKALIHYNCWQMHYCRENLRKYCKAYETKKPCWRMKSGCYCDEDMLLRAMTKSPSQKVELLKESYAQAAQTNSKSLTPAQKRQRCRQCFIYTEHQKQKYQILSPLVFPIVGLVMYMFYSDIMSLMAAALAEVDKLAKAASFIEQSGSISNSVTQSGSSSDVAQWVLIGCLGLMLASYLLQGLEYLIFELQV